MTTEQREYVLKNSGKHTLKEIQVMFDITRNKLYHFVLNNNLPYIKVIRKPRQRDDWAGRCHITGFNLDTRTKFRT